MVFGYTTTKDRYVQQMETLCTFSPNQGSLNVKDVRKIVLYLTQGLAPFHLLADPKTGQLLSATQVCAQATKTIRKNTNTKFADIEEYVRVMMAAKSFVKAELPSVLPVELQRKIQAMAQDTPDDVAAFRAQLVKKRVDVRGVHLFNFDGSPRCSISEIRWAICHFPVSKGKLIQTLGLIAVFGVFSGLVWVAMRTEDKEKIKEAVASTLDKAVTVLNMSKDKAMHMINLILQKIRNKTSGTSSNEIVRQAYAETSDKTDEGWKEMPPWDDDDADWDWRQRVGVFR